MVQQANRNPATQNKQYTVQVEAEKQKLVFNSEWTLGVSFITVVTRKSLYYRLAQVGHGNCLKLIVYAGLVIFGKSSYGAIIYLSPAKGPLQSERGRNGLVLFIVTLEISNRKLMSEPS